jgi:eukaryotic-like serine/threonine-protein kinase
VGKLHHELANYAKAEEALINAVQRADASKSDGLKAQALADLVELVGYVEARAAEGRTFAKLAEGAIARAGGDELLQANLLSSRGDLEWRVRELDSALEHYRTALALRTKHLGPEHPDVATMLSSAGWVLMEQGQLSEATDFYQRALAIREKVFGSKHPKTLVSLSELGVLATRRGRHAEASDYLRRATAGYEQTLGPEHPRVGSALFNLGKTVAALGQTDEALGYMERALAIKEKSSGPEHPDCAIMLSGISGVLRRQRRYEEALERDRRGLEIVQKAGAAAEYVAGMLSSLRDDYLGLRRPAEAVAAARQGLQVAEKVQGAESAKLAVWAEQLAEALAAAGSKAEAIATYERAVKLQAKAPERADELARLRFGLARALGDAPPDRARARELARQALEGYANPDHGKERQEVERWLATHR